MWSRLKNALVMAVAGLGVAAVMLAGAELVARGAALALGKDWRPPPPLPDVPTFRTLCRGTEGSVYLCPQVAGGGGALSRETPFKLVPDRRRIAVLGESFVFGLGIPEADAWPAQLGVALGEEYEVLNFGRCGSESASLVRMLQAAVQVKADTVILAIGNNEYTMTPYYAGLPGRHPVLFQRSLEVLSSLQLFGILKLAVGNRAPHLFGAPLSTVAGHPMQKYINALHGRPADVSVFPNNLADAEVTEMLEGTKRLSERFFALRMAGMIQYARANGVDVVLATLPRALDAAPLLSGLHGIDRSEVEDTLRILRVGDPALRHNIDDRTRTEMIGRLEEVLRKDPHIAHALFVNGMRLLADGRQEDGIQNLLMATDWDLVPDVTPTINGIIVDLAEEYDVPLLDLRPLALEAMGQSGTLFTDPIHLNAAGGRRVGHYAGEQLKPVLDARD